MSVVGIRHKIKHRKQLVRNCEGRVGLGFKGFRMSQGLGL